MSTLRELLPQVRQGEEAYMHGYAMNLLCLSYSPESQLYHLTNYLGEGEWAEPQTFTEEELETWLDDSYDDWDIQ